MTKDANGYLVLWILLSLTYGVADDQGYQQVPSLTNFTKSYLWGGRMTKDTDEYPIPINYTKSFLRDERTTMDTNGYLVQKIK